MKLVDAPRTGRADAPVASPVPPRSASRCPPDSRPTAERDEEGVRDRPLVTFRAGWPVPIELGERLADFEHRGFATGPAATRQRLERCAGAFLAGFNAASRSWPDPHRALAAVVEPSLRGFAYEGAAMSARLSALSRPGRRAAHLRTLLSGPGARYVHLIHVGYGWMPPLGPFAAPTPLPATGLLRWLSLDGAGFCKVFFRGERALGALLRHAERPATRIELTGAGRALWFVACGQPALIRDRIVAAPATARPYLWSGVGLAMGYAGGVDDGTISRLLDAAADAIADVGQGVAFAAAATVLAGEVPPATTAAAHRVFDADPERIAAWVEEASDGLTHRPDVDAYERWRARIRERVAR